MRHRLSEHSTYADHLRKGARAGTGRRDETPASLGTAALVSPLVALWVALVAGCGQDAALPTEPGLAVAGPVVGSGGGDGPAPDVQREATSVEVTGLPNVGVSGQSLLVGARLFDDLGVWWPNQGSATWTTSDPSVATVGGDATYSGAGSVVVAIVGAGVATVSVSVDGLTAEDRITGIDGTPPLSDALAVDSFSVVEITYPETGPDHWYYAPLLVVSDQAGAGAEVFGIQLGVPGIMAGGYCTSARPVPSGQSVELFREVYGDYELTWDRPGYRASPGDATVTVYFLDGAGNAGRVEATGPIAPGPSTRDTYTGRTIADPWSCGHLWIPS